MESIQTSLLLQVISYGMFLMGSRSWRLTQSEQDPTNVDVVIDTDTDNLPVAASKPNSITANCWRPTGFPLSNQRPDLCASLASI